MKQDKPNGSAKVLLKYYKPFLGSIFLIVIFLFIQVMMDLALPKYMAAIIDKGIIAGNMNAIYTTGIIMLGLSLATAASAILVGFFASRVAAKSTKKIRSALFEKVMSFGSLEFDKFSTASLVTRSTNDMQLLQMTVVMLLRMAFLAPMMGIGALIRAYESSPSLSWTLALALLTILCVMLICFSLTMPKFKLVQKKLDRLNLIMNERLSGILVIRAFNMEKTEESRFREANSDLTGLNIFVNRVMSFLMPAMMLVMNLVTVLIVWAGSRAIDMGEMQIGSMLAFMQYSMQAIMSFLFITMIFIMIPRSIVAAQRIGEVLSTETSIQDPAQSLANAKTDFTDKEKSPAAHSIGAPVLEFKNVAFRYPDADEDVVSEISFTARAGQTTAIIGSTGSGKSTIVNLIPRFYDVTHGEILLDGTDIRSMTQHELRSNISYIPQKAVLFSGTIESNLLYGDTAATQEQLEKAAAIAQATDFIDTKESGYNEPIAQGGTNVSGGQKQRLSIARALVKEASVYIFDDSFSALDFKTDANLRKALAENVTNSALIIVGQRINTIKDADQIIVLNDGYLSGIGTHKELLEGCEVYKEIALSQLSQEEL